MAATRITPAQARRLTDEALRRLSLEKGPRGSATAAALLAQEILLERAGHAGINADRHRPHLSKLSDE